MGNQAQALRIAAVTLDQAAHRRRLILECQVGGDLTAQAQAQAVYRETVQELAAWTRQATHAEPPRWIGRDSMLHCQELERWAADVIGAAQEHIGEAP